MIERTWQVIQYEYLSNLKRPSFYLTAIGLPLVVFAMWGVIFLVLNSLEEDDSALRFGYVDNADLVTVAYDDFAAYPNSESANTALENDEIDIYIVIADDYLQSAALDIVSKETLSGEDQETIRSFLRDQISNRQSAIPPERLQRGGVDEMTVNILNSDRTITEEQVPGVLLAPFAFIFLFAFSMQLSGNLLVSGMVEEKTNRIVEVLVTSIGSFPLLAGKLIGLGSLGLSMIGLWFISATAFLTFGPEIDFLSGVSFEPSYLAFAAVYFVLAYMMMGSLLLGVGSIVNSDQEGNQYSGIFNLVLFIPIFFSVSFFEDTNGTLPTALTLIPLTSPSAIMMRLSFGSVPLWQIAFSIISMMGVTVLAIWVSSRLFRWSMLRAGQSINLKTFRNILSGKEALS